MVRVEGRVLGSVTPLSLPTCVGLGSWDDWSEGRSSTWTKNSVPRGTRPGVRRRGLAPARPVSVQLKGGVHNPSVEGQRGSRGSWGPSAEVDSRQTGSQT